MCMGSSDEKSGVPTMSLYKVARSHTMKNRNLALASICAALALLAALISPIVHAQTPTKPPSAEEIVARVNNDVITLSAYQKAEQQLRDEVTRDCVDCPPEKIDAQFKDQQKDLLRGLIDQSLMVQRAKDMGVNVESDVAKRLDEVRKQNGLATLDDLQAGVVAPRLPRGKFKAPNRNRPAAEGSRAPGGGAPN